MESQNEGARTVKSKSPTFLMACLRDNVGGNVAFHAVDGAGYTTNIDKAARYTKEAAQKYWNSAREFDLPLDAEKIEALTVYKVDMQYIPCERVIDKSGCYVAYRKGAYAGNDVFWLDEEGGNTTNFMRAKKLSRPLNDADYICIPFAIADAQKRRTFDASKLNKRKLVQASGLITPAHIKKYRRRKYNPKTRFNCPCCGKISWQHNPHFFEGCKDVYCDEYRSALIGGYCE